MIETQLFNLDKIKEITSPIENLQGKISNLEDIFNKFLEYEDRINQNNTCENFLNQIQAVALLLKDITNELIAISNANVNNFLVFQDNLIQKYRDTLKEHLKKLTIDQTFTKNIGISLIESRQISRIIDKFSFLPAISLNQWLELLESLTQNSLFLSVLPKLNKFFELITKKKFEIELNKIPKDIDPVLIKGFETAFLTEPITFQDFLKNIENKLTKEELIAKKQIIEKAKEKEKLEELKKKQTEQNQSYQDYFKLSDKEFQRKRRKQSREKLTDFSQQSKNLKEISKDVAEKIEKFKSKFEDKFEEQFLKQKDDEQDPLEVIRERKKKKEEEYKEYFKKFEDNK